MEDAPAPADRPRRSATVWPWVFVPWRYMESTGCLADVAADTKRAVGDDSIPPDPLQQNVSGTVGQDGDAVVLISRNRAGDGWNRVRDYGGAGDAEEARKIFGSVTYCGDDYFFRFSPSGLAIPLTCRGSGKRQWSA